MAMAGKTPENVLRSKLAAWKGYNPARHTVSSSMAQVGGHTSFRYILRDMNTMRVMQAVYFWGPNELIDPDEVAAKLATAMVTKIKKWK